MRLLRSVTPSSDIVTALTAVAPATWHHRLGHPPATWHHRLGHLAPDVFSSLSMSSFINCISNKHDLCHACQLRKHIRLPFSGSSNHAAKAFDLIHLDLWTSPVISVSGSK
jgi:hypothetical protein